MRFSLFKKADVRRFDYQPVFYDHKKDTGGDTVEQKRFDFKAAHEQQKSELSPSFGMYHSGTVDYDTDRIKSGRNMKMWLMMGMATVCFIYFVLPRPKMISIIEEAFELPPVMYEGVLFLIVFILLILFIREQNKV